MRLSLYQAVQGTHTDELYKLKVKLHSKVLLKVERNPQVLCMCQKALATCDTTRKGSRML